ncbi:hypothetical protein ASG87_01695 [Frateuria sp. Soil773]|uniref:hypothetical protein n=1 Tax=Frateuria sp. Soil773 TaxID=1736407 RepID=UPI0006F9D12E|nr:hypothetical protein [Frateuria sp. Soil773]KRE90878.1 hypothetical protein ASG87_01695 [Frateuria sp. Soil773]
MTQEPQPTDAGKRRWPHTGGYVFVNDGERLPCTCLDTCSVPYCSGRCGCDACSLAFTITLDEMGVLGPDGYTISEEEGRARFGPLWPNP